jgi:hypothetical protein
MAYRRYRGGLAGIGGKTLPRSADS